MTINELDVRNALERATGHLDSRPGLLDDVRRGGRRQVVRRRTFLGAGLAAGALAASGGVLASRGRGGPMQVASPLLDAPTRGDLAHDRAFLERVRQVWRRWADASDSALAGDMHAVWAGNTPAGPAAFVIQRTADNPVVQQPDGHRLFAVCTFVHTTPDGLHVMTVTQMDDGPTDGVPQAALLGADLDTLVIVDFGAPVSYSADLTIAPDGQVLRQWHPAPLENGAFVTRIGPQRTKLTVALGRPPLGQRDVVHLANVTEIFAIRTQREPRRVHTALPGAERSWGADPLLASTRGSLFGEAALAPYLDPCGLHTAGVDPVYNVVGATPDGRRLWLVTIQWDDGPARHLLFLAAPGGPFALVGKAIVPSGRGDRPVLITVPDRQGTLVAMAGARLRHRAAGGDWLPGGTDAVLLPPEAVDVEVAAPGRVPETIGVPGS